MVHSSKENEVSFIPIVRILIKNWKVLILTTIVGSFISLGVCLLVPPKYKSTVTVFPANLGAVSQVLLDERGSSKDYMAFGEESELEQLQQILHSDEIQSRVAATFKLMDHYKIDPTSRYPQTQLRNRYEKNVHIRKTRFQSIEIEVFDSDPQMAADIANKITELVDTVYKKIQSDRTKEALSIVEREYQAARHYVRQIEDSLDKIRAKGINNYRAEAEVYNAAYAEALATGKNAGLKALQQKIETLSKFGGPSLSLIGELELEQKRVALLRDKLLAAQVNATQTIPRKYVVNQATPSEKKSYPITWLVVVLSGISLFVMTSFLVVSLNSSKES